MSYEPFSEPGIIIQSGIPVIIKDTGGQGNWARVPQPLAGEVGEVLTVQPDLSVAWEPSGGGSGTTLQTSSVIMSNAELRANTPVTLVSAQGSDTVVMPVSIAFIMRYGGSNAFTSDDSFGIRYNGVAGTEEVVTVTPGSAFWRATADRFGRWNAGPTLTELGSENVNTFALTLASNQTLTCETRGTLTGNAANDNTVEVITTYYVISV